MTGGLVKIKKERRIFRNWGMFIFHVVGSIVFQGVFIFAIWFLSGEPNVSDVYRTLKTAPFVVVLLWWYYTDWKFWHVYPLSVVVAQKYICIFTPLKRYCWRWSKIERLEEWVSSKATRRALRLHVKGRGVAYFLPKGLIERQYHQVVQEIRERYGSTTNGE